MYDPKSLCADDFINDEEIRETLAYADANKNNVELIDQILKKAKPQKTSRGIHCAGLSHREASVLLACDIPEKVEEMYALAREIKQAFYGNRIVMFAPLYLSNYCVNGCLYCPYHLKNKHIARKKLTQEEVAAEVIALQDMGHKRLAIEAGEDPVNNPIEYILECINTIYSIKHKNGAIRRVNVNIAATTVENYRRLKDAGIGTYILFQETYHKESYLKLHPTGPKHDYNYHTEAMDRAMEGGIDDVGLGVLFGLQLYRYEFAGLLMHAEHLEAVHGVGPHTISVPRVKRADDIDPSAFDNGISDDIFAKLCALIRIAVPYTGMIISTRESQAVREKVLPLGVSQISGASRTSVGGYSEKERPHDTEQFDVSDQRTLDEVVEWLMEQGHIPSFCTACYREGRTGDRFMSLCKTGQIQNCCHPNALMTLKEYLMDYASSNTRKVGDALIGKELENIPNEKVRALVKKNLEAIAQGQRDFRL
ncbi:MAG: [FeFe] hydrogenase H-cluster radical SAM maturase HydG [Lachnospiraceae bacterium]|nr:[FeFe] hydrogenase H-cluster radical SAM maturase HydG [Lachnospiraceae bacterium]MDD7023395.1 [FeFe] hydrogenase H-cluster radical SAM maturase HydG [Oscillospiraceae bacterium]MDY5540340.1 [FeFe] hydrogenase H-cluster radical SAM maturase HydG [Lachnospiraceae bacterium]MDY5648193.1 [FeFe] hydrogenase H-cluster radical SAM maturase HydG [Lachnospiraceae bacterium]